MYNEKVMLLLHLAVIASAGRLSNEAPQLSVEDLTRMADVVFCGTVIGTEPAEDDYLTSTYGHMTAQTQFRVERVIEGGELGAEVAFRHHVAAESDILRPGGRPSLPTIYNFQPGSRRVVFAWRADDGVLRQVDVETRSKPEMGAFPLPESMVCDGSPSEVVRDALRQLPSDPDPFAATVGIGYLAHTTLRSGWWGRRPIGDLDLDEVVAALRPAFAHPAPRVVKAATYAVRGEAVVPWALDGHPHPIERLDNPVAEALREELIGVVDHPGYGAARSAAAMGLTGVHHPAVLRAALRWSEDPSPQIRASALYILAHYRDSPEANAALDDAHTDPELIRSLPGISLVARRPDIAAALLHSEEMNIADRAARVLALLGGDEAIGALIAGGFKERVDPRVWLVHAESTTEWAPWFAGSLRSRRGNKQAWWMLYRYLGAHGSGIDPLDAEQLLDALATASVKVAGPAERRTLDILRVQRGWD